MPGAPVLLRRWFAAALKLLEARPALVGFCLGGLMWTTYEYVRWTPEQRITDCELREYRFGGDLVVRFQSGEWRSLDEIWPDDADVGCGDGLIGKGVEKRPFQLGYVFADQFRGPNVWIIGRRATGCGLGTMTLAMVHAWLRRRSRRAPRSVP
jgi:hypothetical protein